MLTDSSHTGESVGLCSVVSILLIGNTYKILFSQSDFNYHLILNFIWT